MGVGAFVAGGLVGAVVAQRLASNSPPTVAIHAPGDDVALSPSLAVASSAPEGADSGLLAVPASASGFESEPSRSADASAPRQSAAGRGDLTRERELLDVARAAMAHGSPADAIVAAERHARNWPNGYLTEERETLWIEALAASGRRDEAARKASSFRKAFPKSVLMPAVEAALTARP
jgi:RNA polymerase sigma-70 factor (ECF subfamily)